MSQVDNAQLGLSGNLLVQATGTPIPNMCFFAQISTCTNLNNAFTLGSAPQLGKEYKIRNDGAATAQIFPAVGGTINALAANAAYTLPAGSTVTLIPTSSTQWYEVYQSATFGSAIGAGITAFATGGQLNAVAIPATRPYTLVSVCATAQDSIALPETPVLNSPYVIAVTAGQAAVAVYPGNTAARNSVINSYAANAPAFIGGGASLSFVAVSNVANLIQWYSFGYTGPKPFIPLTATPTVLGLQHAECTMLCNVATGVFTMPSVASSLGSKFTFLLGATGVGTLQTINGAAGTPMIGVAMGGPNAGVVSRSGAGTGSVRFGATCVAGDRWELISDGTNFNCVGLSSGNVAATSVLFV